MLVIGFAEVSFAAVAVKVGKVEAVSGEAMVLRYKAQTPVALTLNAPIYLRDLITTGKDGKVKLFMKDSTMLTLGKDSKLEIKEYLIKPDKGVRKSTLGLMMGTLRSFVAKAFKAAGNKFEVETPTAVAGVRGTNFSVRVYPDGRVTVLCTKGSAFVFNRALGAAAGQTVVTANMATNVEPGKAPTPAFPATPEMLNDMSGGNYSSVDVVNAEDESDVAAAVEAAAAQAAADAQAAAAAQAVAAAAAAQAAADAAAAQAAADAAAAAAAANPDDAALAQAALDAAQAAADAQAVADAATADAAAAQAAAATAAAQSTGLAAAASTLNSGGITISPIPSGGAGGGGVPPSPNK